MAPRSRKTPTLSFLGSPYALPLSLAALATINQASISIFNPILEPASSYYDVQLSQLIWINDRLPKLAAVLSLILLNSTDWIIKKFSYLTIVSAFASLLMVFLREKSPDFPLAIITNCLAAAIQPVLILSATYGFLNVSRLGKTTLESSCIAASIYFAIQMGSGLPTLYFSRNILRKEEFLLTHLEEQSYIQNFQKLLILLACLSSALFLYIIKNNLRNIQLNLTSLASERSDDYLPEQTISSFSYFNTKTPQNIHQQASPKQGRALLIKCSGLLLGWGILSGIGVEFDKLYDHLNIQKVLFFSVYSRIIALLISIVGARLIYEKYKNPMLVSFIFTSSALFLSLVLIALQLLPLPRQHLLLNIFCQALPILVSAAYQGFAVIAIFYIDERLKQSDFFKANLNCLQIGALFLLVQSISSLLCAQMLQFSKQITLFSASISLFLYIWEQNGQLASEEWLIGGKGRLVVDMGKNNSEIFQSLPHDEQKQQESEQACQKIQDEEKNQGMAIHNKNIFVSEKAPDFQNEGQQGLEQQQRV